MNQGSVLFTDLVGFTEFNGAVGDRVALDVLEQQTEIAHNVIDDSSDARLVKELGDGLMIWLGPAHDGLIGAMALLDAVESARSENGFPLAIRMGMHYGDVTPRGDDIVGQTVNIAARVSALAGPGELLVSEQVVKACGMDEPPVPLIPVGPATVKGVRDAIWLYRVATASKGR